MIRFFSLLLIFFTSLVYGGWFDGLSINSNEEDRVKGVFRKITDGPLKIYSLAFLLVEDGRVLIGSKQIFDPKTNTIKDIRQALDYSPPNNGGTGRQAGILLRDGRVLLVGDIPNAYSAKTQLFDPKTETLSIGSDMKYEYERSRPNLTMLRDGRVVVMQPGKAEDLEERSRKKTDYSTCFWATYAEIYDPKTDSFEKGGRMLVDRGEFSVLKTPDEKILIIGGNGAPRDFGSPKEVELYDPTTKKSKIVGKLLHGKRNPIVQYLPDGKILVMGGYAKDNDLAFPDKPTKIAEIFNPVDGTSERVQDSIWFTPQGSVSFLVGDQVVMVSALRAQGFDTKTKSFYKIADMGEDEERRFFTAISVKGDRSLIGGGSYMKVHNGSKPLDMWLFEVTK